MNIGYRDFNWKVVKNSKTTSRLCPRCNNQVEYQLVKDSEGIGIGMWTLIPIVNRYALKCPICPEAEEITRGVAKTFRR